MEKNKQIEKVGTVLFLLIDNLAHVLALNIPHFVEIFEINCSLNMPTALKIGAGLIICCIYGSLMKDAPPRP